MGKQFSEILSERLYSAGIEISADFLGKFDFLPEDKQSFILSWNFGALKSFEDFMCNIEDEGVNRFESYALEEEGVMSLVTSMNTRITLGRDWIPTYEEFDCVRQEWQKVIEYPVTQEYSKFLRTCSVLARASLCDTVRTMALMSVADERYGEWRDPIVRRQDLCLRDIHRFLEGFYKMVGKLPNDADWNWVYGEGIDYKRISDRTMKPDILFTAGLSVGITIGHRGVFVQDLTGSRDMWVVGVVDSYDGWQQAMFSTLLHTLCLCGAFMGVSDNFNLLLRQHRINQYHQPGIQVEEMNIYNLCKWLESAINKPIAYVEEECIV